MARLTALHLHCHRPRAHRMARILLHRQRGGRRLHRLRLRADLRDGHGAHRADPAPGAHRGRDQLDNDLHLDGLGGVPVHRWGDRVARGYGQLAASVSGFVVYCWSTNVSGDDG